MPSEELSGKSIGRTVFLLSLQENDKNMEWIAPTITAIGTIITAWFAYNQRTKDKMTDYKLRMIEEDNKAKVKQAKSSVSKIYGVLWGIAFELKCARAYIIQPHPLIKNHFLSVELEIKRNCINSVKEDMRRLKMSDFAVFSSELSSRDFVYYPNLECIKDKRTRSLFSNIGSSRIVIKRLMSGDVWVGNIIVDFMEDADMKNMDYIKKFLSGTADDIQYILPEIDEDDDIS